MKRVLDILLASFGILIFLPLAILFAICVKVEDGGPILYTQLRWGKLGRKFRAYKFRTMVADSDEKWGPKPAEEDDVRITKTGKVLRATAMDELPQLINIWKGDMSFVGPRAFSVQELDSSFPGFQERHQVQPGLTGPAQIYAPRNATFEEKFQYDLSYIRTRSFWGDLGLMFLSVWITLRGSWESRKKKY